MDLLGRRSKKELLNNSLLIANAMPQNQHTSETHNPKMSRENHRELSPLLTTPMKYTLSPVFRYFRSLIQRFPATENSKAPMRKAKFASRSEFSKKLTDSVDLYFTQNNRSPFATPAMIFKSISVVTLAILSYLTLLLWADSVVTTLVAAFVFSQAIVMIGFSIMHDANHGSYSSSKLINRILGFSLDFVGGSSLLWCQKHNFLHHSYTNINDLDDDIQTAGFIRLSPHQPIKKFQKFQHIYALFLYSILTLYWFLFNDFVQFFKKRIGPYKVRAIGTSETVLFLLFKVIYVGYMIVLPLQFHHWYEVIPVFLLIHAIAGVTISVVFQLAHTLECNAFPEPDSSGKLSADFAIHQLETTANFSPNNRLLTWYLGGLNYQIEHHLFPKVCHVHYPALSVIVEKTCQEFGVPYKNSSSLLKAVRDHFAFLKATGQAETTKS